MDNNTAKEINFFEELFGKYVQMNDRFESVHIWSKELAIKNNGKWIPLEISKEKYEKELLWDIRSK